MKLIYLCNEYPPQPAIGGIGIFTRTIAQEMAHAGHDVTVVGYGKGNGARWDGAVRVVTLPELNVPRVSWLLNRYRLFRYLQKSMRDHGVDIIEVPEYQGLLPFHFPACPVVVRLHHSQTSVDMLAGDVPKAGMRFLERRTLQAHRNWIAVSNYILDRTRRVFNLEPSRWATIYNPAFPDEGDGLDDFKLPEPYVLFAGTVSERKGADTLAQAACSFLGAFPELHLVYVGAVVNIQGEPADQKIRKIVGENLSRRVHFTGLVPHPHVFAWMRRARAFIFPSRLEAFPIVCVEAMYCGTPVIFSRTGPGPEVIEDGVTGLLVDPYDHEDIAEKVIHVLTNPAKAERLASIARQTAQKRFAPDNCMKLSLDFYSKCAGSVVRS